MKRREFIQSTAAVAVAPLGVAQASSVVVSDVIVAEAAAMPSGASLASLIPWRHFLDGYFDPPMRKFDMQSVFVRDGWLYATDSRIAIRIPTQRPDTKPPEGGKRFPPADLLPGWPDGTETDWLAWPERDKPTENQCCPACGGRGMVGWVKTCSLCGGDGMEAFSDNDDHVLDCHACGGSGNVYREVCPYCEGFGRGRLVSEQRVGDRFVCGWYDSIIRKLPGPVEFIDGRDSDAAVVFRFGGAGQGLVMPLARRDD